MSNDWRGRNEVGIVKGKYVDEETLRREADDSRLCWLGYNNNTVYFVLKWCNTKVRCLNKTPICTIMVWTTIHLHGCQIHYYVVYITPHHSITGDCDGWKIVIILFISYKF